MALKKLVKVGKITNLSDARYCAGMGVDMLGFTVIGGQDGFISVEQFREIRGWFTGPLVVAEVYGITNQHELNTIMENYAPDYLELSAHDLQIVQPGKTPLIVSLDLSEAGNFQPEKLQGKVEYVKVSARINPEQINQLARHIKVMVELDTPVDTEVLINSRSIHGIAMQGGVEERPGLKQYHQLAQVLESLEVE